MTTTTKTVVTKTVTRQFTREELCERLGIPVNAQCSMTGHTCRMFEDWIPDGGLAATWQERSEAEEEAP